MTVDILLATYNGSKYVEEQLNSILNQTWDDFNLIISDDCSTDETRSILAEYDGQSNVTIYYQKSNLGYKKNFEFLTSKITSEYCMFSDQDDVWESNKIEEMMKVMMSGKYSLVYCDLKIVDQNLNEIHPSMIRFMNKLQQCNFNDFRSITIDNVVSGCALLTKKEIIDKAVPFANSPFVHDWWLAVIATQVGSIFYLDKALVKYRQHVNNVIGIKSQQKEKFSFFDYRNQLIEFKVNQFKECNKRRDVFTEEYKVIIDTALEYFANINTRKYNAIQKIKMFNTIYIGLPFAAKIKKILLFHYPRLAKVFYTIRGRIT